ncbi:hypothetical protein C8R44DRAFT_734616 [Mycena epipterygia]|nr:hypothetical protein C8R44DRAFT_734616 [Mycena epipterygia]
MTLGPTFALKCKGRQCSSSQHIFHSGGTPEISYAAPSECYTRTRRLTTTAWTANTIKINLPLVGGTCRARLQISITIVADIDPLHVSLMRLSGLGRSCATCRQRWIICRGSGMPKLGYVAQSSPSLVQTSQRNGHIPERLPMEEELCKLGVEPVDVGTLDGKTHAAKNFQCRCEFNRQTIRFDRTVKAISTGGGNVF